MKFHRAIHIAAIWMWLCAPLAWAQLRISDYLLDPHGVHAGATTMQFLTLSSSAQDHARGISSAQAGVTADQLPRLRAKSAFLQSPRASISHLEWFLGLRKELAAGLYPLQRWGTIGWYSTIYSLGRFEYARDINERPSQFQAVEYAVATSYAQRFLRNRIALGVVGKYIESHLAGVSARAVALDADLWARPTPRSELQLWFANIGTPVVYSSKREQLPVEFGASVALHPRAPDPQKRQIFDYNIAAGAYKPAEEPLLAGVSAEVSFEQKLFLQLGLQVNPDSGLAGRKVSLGGGYQYQNYRFDASIADFGAEFGPNWLVALHLIVPHEPEQLSAEEYYQRALKLFGRAKFEDAIVTAKKALIKDPNHWQARVLIQQAAERLDRKHGYIVDIYYVGGEQGQLLQQTGQEAVLGGLAREATFLQQARKNPKSSLSLHIGEISHQAASDEMLRVINSFLELPYIQAVSVGVAEAALLAEQTSPPHLSRSVAKKALSTLPLIPNTQQSTIVELGKSRVGIISAIRPARQTPAAFAAELNQQIAATYTDRCDAVVAVIHDQVSTIGAYAHILRGIDCIIAPLSRVAIESQQLAAAEGQVPITLVASGLQSGFGGKLQLRFSATDSLKSIRHSLFALSEQIAPDPQVAQWLHHFAANALDSAGIQTDSVLLQQSTAENAMIFIDASSGREQLYLRNIEKKATIALTNSPVPIKQGMWHPQASFFAYLTDQSELFIIDPSLSTHTKFEDITFSQFNPATRSLWAIEQVAPGNQRIVSISLDNFTVTPRRPLSNRSVSELHFSPTAGLLSYTEKIDGYYNVFLTDTTLQSPRQISRHGADCSFPRFSPDEMSLAYLVDYGSLNQQKDIWLYDRRRGTTERITFNAAVNGLCWHPREQIIIYSQASTPAELMKYDLKTGKSSVFSRDLPVDVSRMMPRIRTIQGQQRLVYLVITGEQRALYTTTLQGENETMLLAPRAGLRHADRQIDLPRR